MWIIISHINQWISLLIHALILVNVCLDVCKFFGQVIRISTKPPLDLGYIWIITSHWFAWMELLIYALILMLVQSILINYKKGPWSDPSLACTGRSHYPLQRKRTKVMHDLLESRRSCWKMLFDQYKRIQNPRSRTFKKENIFFCDHLQEWRICSHVYGLIGKYTLLMAVDETRLNIKSERLLMTMI